MAADDVIPEIYRVWRKPTLTGLRFVSAGVAEDSIIIVFLLYGKLVYWKAGWGKVDSPLTGESVSVSTWAFDSLAAVQEAIASNSYRLEPTEIVRFILE